MTETDFGASRQGEKIIIDKSLLLGQGGSKDVYIDPRDSSRCIKINVREENPRDLRMEMAYRRARKRRGLPPSTLMVDYYGTVLTDLGIGYVFERIADYDGATSQTIDDLIKLESAAREGHTSAAALIGREKKIPPVYEILIVFRRVLFFENIIMPDMGAFNYAVQFDSPGEWRIRIVDDLGSPMLIPLYYYIDFLGRGHVRRRWVKFIKEIMTLYPLFLSEDESRELMKV